MCVCVCVACTDTIIVSSLAYVTCIPVCVCACVCRAGTISSPQMRVVKQKHVSVPGIPNYLPQLFEKDALFEVPRQALFITVCVCVHIHTHVFHVTMGARVFQSTVCGCVGVCANQLTIMDRATVWASRLMCRFLGHSLPKLLRSVNWYSLSAVVDVRRIMLDWGVCEVRARVCVCVGVCV